MHKGLMWHRIAHLKAVLAMLGIAYMYICKVIKTASQATRFVFSLSAKALLVLTLLGANQFVSAQEYETAPLMLTEWRKIVRAADLFSKGARDVSICIGIYESEPIPIVGYGWGCKDRSKDLSGYSAVELGNKYLDYYISNYLTNHRVCGPRSVEFTGYDQNPGLCVRYENGAIISTCGQISVRVPLLNNDDEKI